MYAQERSWYGRALEGQVGLEVLGDLSHQALEGQVGLEVLGDLSHQALEGQVGLDVLGDLSHQALEGQVGLEVLGDLSHQALEGQLVDEQFGGLLVAPDLSHQALEGQLVDEQFGRLLVAPDLTEGHGPRLVAVRLLDVSGGQGAFVGGLGSQMLPRSTSCYNSLATQKCMRRKYYLHAKWARLNLYSLFSALPFNKHITSYHLG